MNVQFLKSSVQKIIINSDATNHFFQNRAYFSTYKEPQHIFQIVSWKVLAAYGYSDVILHLFHPDRLKAIWTIKKVSWFLLLDHNLLSTIPFAKKDVAIFFRQIQIPSKISNHKEPFGVTNIIDNQYVIRTKDYFHTNILDQEVINAVILISICI